MVQAVGHRRGGRFVEQAQHVQAGARRGVLGGLALRVVEVGRHGDHRADQRAAQRAFGALAPARAAPRRRCRPGSSGRGVCARRPRCRTAPRRRTAKRRGVDVGQRAADQPLGRGDGVGRVVRRALAGRVADAHARRPRRSARPRAAAGGPVRRAAPWARRCAPWPPASWSCPGRCRPPGGAGAALRRGRVRRSAAGPSATPD